MGKVKLKSKMQTKKGQLLLELNIFSWAWQSRKYFFEKGKKHCIYFPACRIVKICLSSAKCLKVSETDVTSTSQRDMWDPASWDFTTGFELETFLWAVCYVLRLCAKINSLTLCYQLLHVQNTCWFVGFFFLIHNMEKSWRPNSEKMGIQLFYQY